jgi:hypothetical protein
VSHETDLLDPRIGGKHRRQAVRTAANALPRAAAPAGARSEKRAGDQCAGAAVVPVVRAVWIDAAGQTRLRITHVTRASIDFHNLNTGGHGLMSRAWFEQHFTPLS